MSEQEATGNEEISLFALGTILLRNRWRIVRWMLLGGVLAALSVVNKPLVYTATASFMPQGVDAGRSGLAGLAGQFGVTIPMSAQSSLPPDFYSRLLESRDLLQPITRDTFVVPEMGGRRVPFFELFGITGGSVASREEQGVSKLAGIVG